MCYTGSCIYEINDYDNGGTICKMPKGGSCPMDDERYDDIYDDEPDPREDED